MLPGSDALIAPTHWSFGQLASLVGAPAAYLRQLPAPLAGINLQYGLTSRRAEQVKTLEIEDGRVELRAVNHRRLLEPTGNIPPTEAEERYYALLDEQQMAA